MSSLNKLIIIVLTLVSFSAHAQTNCSRLIQKIKKDTEWNLPNYFDDIEKTLKSNCRGNEKATLLLMKSNYFYSVQQIDTSMALVKRAWKYIEKNEQGDSIRALVHMRKTGLFAELNDFSSAYQEWVKCNNYYVLHKDYSGMSYSQQILAVLFIHLNQMSSAKKALVRAKKYAMVDKNKRVLYDLYNSMSGYWYKRNNSDSSLYYLQLSEQYEPIRSIKLNKEAFKATIYLNKNDLKNARLYFQESINKAEKAHCLGYSGIGKYGLAITYMDEDHDKAFRLMKEALTLIDDHNPDLGINICECILSNFTGKEYEALFPFFEKRKQQLKRKRDRIDNIQVGKLFEMTSQTSEDLLRTQNALEQKKEREKDQQIVLFVFSFIGIVLIVSISIVGFAYRARTRAQAKLNEAYEKQRQILTHSLVTITNHNATAEGLTKKLKNMALQQSSKKLSDELYELSRTVSENTIGSDSKELKDLGFMIQSINDGYVKRLCSKFSDLTANEITLAIYLRMNFSTKQIAELKGVSENSIDVARSRLRTKLGIKGENIDLSHFLNKI